MTQLELGEKLFKQFIPHLSRLRRRFIANHVIPHVIHGAEQYLVWAAEEGMKGVASNPAIAPVLTPTEIADLIAYYALTHEFNRRSQSDQSD